AVAVGFTLLAAVPALIRAIAGPQPEWSHIPSFPVLVLIYVIGGIFGGAVVGGLWWLARWWLGRRVLGALAAIPLMLIVGFTFGNASLTADDLWIWALSGVVWGTVMSFIPE